MTTVSPRSSVSMPVTRPREAEMSPITAPA